MGTRNRKPSRALVTMAGAAIALGATTAAGAAARQQPVGRADGTALSVALAGRRLDFGTSTAETG